MFNFSKHESKESKCYFTHSTLPSSINENQPPVKVKPFSTISSHPWAHTVNVILPEEIYELIKQELNGDAGTLRYMRVNMSLSEIISGDFFNQYIKTGNVLMLSEGRPGVDNLYSLRDGILRLEVDRATYERCGLVGRAIRDGGRKHTKCRFAIELNLRLPSMLHGKKGFERIVYAFKNVLNHSLTWLFVDLNAVDGATTTTTTTGSHNQAGPIHQHHPLPRTIHPQHTHITNALVPPLTSPPTLSDPHHAEQLLEYLHLVALDSPRIRADDSINRFLSRYQVPTFDDGAQDAMPEARPRNLVRLQWRGFASARFVLGLWMAARRAAEGGRDWVGLSVGGFGGKGYTVLGLQGGDVLNWEWE